LQGVPICSLPLSSGPLQRVARGRTRPGVILIGDAGGYLDACTGEGITLALEQALRLMQTIVPVLKQHRAKPTQRELAVYAEDCRRITRPYYFGTRLQLYLCRHPRIADRLLRAVNEQKLLSHFLSANMGTRPFWPGWRAASRLLVSFLRQGVTRRCSPAHPG
jgi:flavin-dependent dehydrogenase